MKLNKIKALIIFSFFSLSGCDGELSTCDGVQAVANNQKKVEKMIVWVDNRYAKNTIGSMYEVRDKAVFRPGNYSIAPDFDFREIGFTNDVVARVILDEKNNPVSIFIGEAPSVGIIVKLSDAKDFTWSPVLNRTANHRIAFVCTRPLTR